MSNFSKLISGAAAALSAAGSVARQVVKSQTATRVPPGAFSHPSESASSILRQQREGPPRAPEAPPAPPRPSPPSSAPTPSSPSSFQAGPSRHRGDNYAPPAPAVGRPWPSQVASQGTAPSVAPPKPAAPPPPPPSELAGASAAASSSSANAGMFEQPLGQDGTPTEMKILNDPRSAASSAAQQPRKPDPEALKRLDETFAKYFAEAADGAKGAAEGVKEAAEEVKEVVKDSKERVEEKSPVSEVKAQAAAPAESKVEQPEAAAASESSTTSQEHDEPTPAEKAQAALEGKKVTQPEPIDTSTPVASSAREEVEEYDATKEVRATPLRAAKVPSSKIARLFHYGSLGAGMAWGAAGSYLTGGGAAGADGKKSSAFMSESNVRRLVDKLSTMRGAALKLGQFMSIQDSNMLPEQIEEVLLRVQNSAHYMPAWQMEQVMREDLGTEWREQFESFADVPFAAASIGQVHAAVLSKDHPSPLRGQKVAVKIQFPGVRESIGSDLSNLSWLVTASALLPKGLFLDNTIRVMRGELDDECDYVREAEMGRRFGKIFENSSIFAAPRIVDELSSPRVLTTEMMRGRPLTQASRFSQEKRDQIAGAILELSLRELFEYRLMQTDPNWTNFLYNERTGKIELIDFGATREYSKEFMDKWLMMLRAAIGGRRDECIYWSEKMGYLTGEESQPMRDAHVDSMIALGEPFRADAPDPYEFANQTITDRVRAQIPLMLRERLTPPPSETYSLNRKLSGAFLLCARLKARVGCNKMMEKVTKDYVIGDLSDEATPGYASSKSSVSAPSGFGSDRRSYHTSAPRREAQASEVRGLRALQRGRLDLSNRWPRHIVDAVTSEKDEVPTLAGATTGAPSVTAPGATEAEGSPAGQGGRAEDPKTAVDVRGPQETKVVIRGVTVPEKPAPPGPEDCCMSGCAHCVYDDFADALSDFHEDVSKAREALLALSPPVTEAEWRVDLLGAKPDVSGAAGTAMSEKDKEEAKRKAEKEVDAVIGSLDPSMKVFLEMERKMKRAKAG